LSASGADRARRRAAAALAALLALSGCAGGGGQAELSLGPVDVPVATTVAATTTTAVDPSIQDLMAGAGMTEAGRALFLAARPQLEDPSTLAESCASLSVPDDPGGTHTYGCVVDGRIHVRTFASPALRDLSYVVAAHELLHVVYARLRGAERAAIDAELRAARSGNQALERRLRVYAEVAEDTPNEVHAVLGTEFAGLSPALEAHYGTYIDRARVVATFRRTLGQRQDEILGLKTAAEESEARLTELDAELEAFRAAGDVRSFNASVGTFNALVREHNETVRQLNARINELEALTAA
jgi:hypothetical protein